MSGAGSPRRELGRRLAGVRKAAGYTQEQLAVAVGYSRSTVSNAEIGHPDIALEFWARCDRVLNAPGKFLISAPEHDIPRRARAYLLTDEAVSATASQHADLRPELDEVSRRALDERAQNRPPATRDELGTDHGSEAGSTPDAGDIPDVLLWSALSLLPEKASPWPTS